MKVIDASIRHRFKGMNEYSGAQRANKYKGAQIKKEETNVAQFAFMAEMPVEDNAYPLHIAFIWREPNKRRDPDNIASAKKFILDGMQKAGVIRNDGWLEIASTQDVFCVDKDDVGVTVIATSKEWKE